MSKDKLDLSIIIISYNTKELTLNTLKSIYQHTKNISFEIIIIDHNSKDNSVTALKKFGQDKKNFTLLGIKENPGFGAGNNRGAKLARGEYLLFLNSDTLLRENSPQKAVDFLKKHSQIGVYSCQLLNPDLTVQPTGGYFPTLSRIFAWQFFIDDLPFIGRFIKSIHPHKPNFFFLNKFLDKNKIENKKDNKSFYHQPQRPDWVTGAFIMIPKKVFDQVGGFDEKIWMYAEEMELCYRIKKLGFKVAYETNSAIIHLGGGSGTSTLAVVNEIKNIIYFFKKHKSPWQLPLVKLFFIIGSSARLLIFGVLKRNGKALKSYQEAIVAST